MNVAYPSGRYGSQVPLLLPASDERIPCLRLTCGYIKLSIQPCLLGFLNMKSHPRKIRWILDIWFKAKFYFKPNVCGVPKTTAVPYVLYLQEVSVNIVSIRLEPHPGSRTQHLSRCPRMPHDAWILRYRVRPGGGFLKLGDPQIIIHLRLGFSMK